MKKLVFIFCALWMLAGCSTEESANVPVGMLSKINVQPVSGSPYVTRLYYNGHKLDRIESSNNTRKIFYYDSNLIVNIKTYSDTFFQTEERFRYDQSGRLLQTDRIDYFNDSHSRLEYIYNLDETITAREYHLDDSGTQSLAATGTMSFENGQLSHQVVVSETNPAVSIGYDYTYDDKPVPYRDIVGWDKISAFEPWRYSGSIHNLILVAQQASDSPEILTYATSYTYSPSGLPATSTEDSGTAIGSGSKSYFYK